MSADGRQRPRRRAALAVLAIVFVLQAVPALGAFVPVVARDGAASVDHVSLAVAAELAANEPGSLYDLDAQRAVQTTLDPAGPPRPFANPPFVATAARLVDAHGIGTGYLALAVVDLLVVAGLATLVWRQARPRALATRLALATGSVAAFPVASVMAEGGVSGIAAAGTALVLWGESRRRPTVTAAGLVLAAAKPHLLVAALVVLVVRRRWTTLGRAAGIGSVAILLSLLTPGLQAWRAYPAALLGVAGSDSPAVRLADHWWNVASLLHRLLGQGGSGLAVVLTWAVLALGLVVIAQLGRADDGPVTLAAALVVGLLVSPHTNPGDALWLPLAFVIALTDPDWGRRRPTVRYVLGGLAVIWPAASLTSFAWSAGGGSVVAVTTMAAFALLSTATGTRQRPTGTGRALDAPASGRAVRQPVTVTPPGAAGRA